MSVRPIDGPCDILRLSEEPWTIGKFRHHILAFNSETQQITCKPMEDNRKCSPSLRLFAEKIKVIAEAELSGLCTTFAVQSIDGLPVLIGQAIEKKMRLGCLRQNL